MEQTQCYIQDVPSKPRLEMKSCVWFVVVCLLPLWCGSGGAGESLAECRAAALLTFKAETRALFIPPAPLVAGREAC